MKRIKWNSPVILWFVLICGVVLLLNYATAGATNNLLFSIYKSSFKDPLFYIRIFGHVLGHANIEHYLNNMMMLLLVGPLLEEKYGSSKMITIMAVVAVVTGIVHIFLQGNTALLGASGIVFAFILLASTTGRRKDNEIPVTLILVALLYIGEQVYQGIFLKDTVSQLTHIVGGIIGAGFGMMVKTKNN